MGCAFLDWQRLKPLLAGLVPGRGVRGQVRDGCPAGDSFKIYRIFINY